MSQVILQIGQDDLQAMLDEAAAKALHQFSKLMGGVKSAEAIPNITITQKEACKRLQTSVNTFTKNYRPKLTKVKEGVNDKFYLNQVMALKERIGKTA